MDVRDLSKSGQKFSTNAAGQGQTAYKESIAGAGQKWKTAVDNSEEKWGQGVQQAISRGAYKKGTSKAGSEYYTSRALKLGVDRYGPGVREGASNWQEGFQPYHDTLKNMAQSPGGPKGDPRNAQRSLEVQIALRRKKEELA